jgi:CHASE3 domain sensor protein
MALSAAALIAFGAAATFLIQSERQISRRLDANRTFDQLARDAASELSGMRAAQQAYVAAGQGVDFWIPEVAALMGKTAGRIEELRASAVNPDAARALADAAASIGEFGDVDKRARDYLRNGEQLMAADVVFTEGGETSSAAAQRVDAARLAEQQAFDAYEARTRRLQAYSLAAAGAFALLAIVILVPRPRESTISPAGADADPGGLILRDEVRTPAPVDPKPRDAVPALKQAAALCTDFGRVTDIEDLRGLLARSTEMIDASGLVVWLGSVGGADLRPVLAHGYPSEALAQMPAVPRAADNAAAAAYRTGRFQIVMADRGAAHGAVVAPLLSPDGCIGALAAEMRGGGETSDTVQALAAIVAAQLASVLASSVPADEQTDSVSRTAAG